MQTCLFTTLKKHSTGLPYAPIQLGIDWQLKNASGDVLTGYRGKIFAFKSAENARTWLCTNLARVKNAKGSTPTDFIVQLHVIYSETQYPPILAELEAIRALDAGEWMPILCEASVQYIEIEASVDYDGGNSEGIVI